jgi:hypothetical protein
MNFEGKVDIDPGKIIQLSRHKMDTCKDMLQMAFNIITVI